MNKRVEWVKALIILPTNVLIIIPSIILYAENYRFTMPDIRSIILASGLAFIGLFFATQTMLLFDKKGDGTAAPWAPPKIFVVEGAYCYVRNPMILSVLTLISAEIIFFKSSGLFYWLVIFWGLNTLYFIFIEEKALEKRFGQDYIKYKQNVPRWIPRIKKYHND